MDVKVLAPAKINLTLEVLGKRPDGYHDISTVMQSVDLCDQLPSVTMTAAKLPFPAIMTVSRVTTATYAQKAATDILIIAAGMCRECTYILTR